MWGLELLGMGIRGVTELAGVKVVRLGIWVLLVSLLWVGVRVRLVCVGGMLGVVLVLVLVVLGREIGLIGVRLILGMFRVLGKSLRGLEMLGLSVLWGRRWRGRGSNLCLGS